MKKTMIFAAVALLWVSCGNKTGGAATDADSTAMEVTEVSDSLNKEVEAPAVNEDEADLLVLAPDLGSNTPLNLSGMEDHKDILLPDWTDEELQNDETGKTTYKVNLKTSQGVFQQLCGGINVRPTDMNEFGRLIIADVNFDGHSDVLVCLGRYDMEEYLYFDAWLWDPSKHSFAYNEDFQYYGNPAIVKSKKEIIECTDEE